MILIIASQELESPFVGMEIAGRSLPEHFAAEIQSLQLADVRIVDEHGATPTEETGGIGGTLLVEKDAWFSRQAATRLLEEARSRRDAFKVTAAAHEIARYLPASRTATKPSGRDVVERLRRMTIEDVVQARALDEQWPPMRVMNFLDVADVERAILRWRVRDALFAGVRMRDPESVTIRGELRCGANVEIDRNVILEGLVQLGDNVRIGPNSRLANATIGPRSRVETGSIVEGAVVGADTFIGPYGRLRPNTLIGDSVQIGNFVEVKSSTIGDRSRVNHMAFVGDAQLGDHVTMGAGTIICNHDGATIQRTDIQSGAYVGSGTLLVAPLTVGANATIGAGSAITKNVPPDKLTLARSRQVTIDRWQRRGRRGA
jgi:acetyltransferase-like isoleucine patch superfamily enzyme